MEDDPASTRLATFHLEQLSANVEHAENGQIAVDKALKNVYDLILMDMEMPVLNGFDAVTQLRERGYSGTIVAATALTQAEDTQRCLDVGCDKYISKPYTREMLENLIRSLREEPLFSSFCDDPAMADMIETYVQELPAKIRTIEEALAAQDASRLEYIARTLKGEGSGYGFDVISEAAGEIESALIGGASLDEVLKEVKTLVKLCMQARSSARAETADSG